MLKLDRVLFSAVHYPGDYGFIPRTLHEDGDPLDVLVLVKEQTFPGCMIDVRPIGVLEDARPRRAGRQDPRCAAARSVSAGVLRHRRHPAAHAEGGRVLLSTYKDLEGKRVEIIGWEKSEEAMRIIRSRSRGTTRRTELDADRKHRARAFASSVNSVTRVGPVG